MDDRRTTRVDPRAGAERRCHACGSASLSSISERDRAGAPMSTVVCGRCSLVFTDPLPSADELHGFYQDAYREEYKGSHSPSMRRLHRAGTIAAHRLRQIARLTPIDGRKVLEIGSGGGEFAYFMSRAGADVLGLELHRGYGRFAMRSYGLRIEPQTVYDFRSDRKFDLVLMYHVLEHLVEPRAALENVAAHLAPGGLFFVEVPNILSDAGASRHVFHKAHVFHYNHATLADALAAAGLTVVYADQSDDGGNILAAAVKSGQPAARICERPHLVREIRRIHVESGFLSEYLSVKAVRRFVAKNAQRVRELVASRGHADARACLDSIYDRLRPADVPPRAAEPAMAMAPAPANAAGPAGTAGAAARGDARSDEPVVTD